MSKFRHTPESLPASHHQTTITTSSRPLHNTALTHPDRNAWETTHVKVFIARMQATSKMCCQRTRPRTADPWAENDTSYGGQTAEWKQCSISDTLRCELTDSTSIWINIYIYRLTHLSHPPTRVAESPIHLRNKETQQTLWVTHGSQDVRCKSVAKPVPLHDRNISTMKQDAKLLLKNA